MKKRLLLGTGGMIMSLILGLIWNLRWSSQEANESRSFSAESPRTEMESLHSESREGESTHSQKSIVPDAPELPTLEDVRREVLAQPEHTARVLTRFAEQFSDRFQALFPSEEGRALLRQELARCVETSHPLPQLQAFCLVQARRVYLEDEWEGLQSRSSPGAHRLVSVILAGEIR